MIDLLLASFLIAQEYPGCFALDTQGNYIDLNYLCNYPTDTPEQNNSAENTTHHFTNDELYKASYYAGYCSAIAQGRSPEQAKKEALELAGARLFATGQSVGTLSDALFIEIAKINMGDTPCPD